MWLDARKKGGKSWWMLLIKHISGLEAYHITFDFLFFLKKTVYFWFPSQKDTLESLWFWVHAFCLQEETILIHLFLLLKKKLWKPWKNAYLLLKRLWHVITSLVGSSDFYRKVAWVVAWQQDRRRGVDGKEEVGKKLRCFCLKPMENFWRRFRERKAHGHIEMELPEEQPSSGMGIWSWVLMGLLLWLWGKNGWLLSACEEERPHCV